LFFSANFASVFPRISRDKLDPVNLGVLCVKGFEVLVFGAAPAKPEDLNLRLRQIEAARRLPRQLFVVNEIPFNILHGLAAGADQMMMRFEISLYQKSGGVGADFPQQSVLDEQPQVLVDGS
jgi:hypothetical protein